MEMNGFYHDELGCGVTGWVQKCRTLTAIVNNGDCDAPLDLDAACVLHICEMGSEPITSKRFDSVSALIADIDRLCAIWDRCADEVLEEVAQ
jgi:hypothetical protein